MTDSRVALGALSRGRSSSRRVNGLLTKAAALCLCYRGSSSTSCGSQPGATLLTRRSRGQPLSPWRNALTELPPVPPASLLSQQAEKELRQLTEPIPQILAGLGKANLGIHRRLRRTHHRPPRRSPLPLQSGQSLAMCSVVAPCRRRHLRERSQLPHLFHQRVISAWCRAERRIPTASNRRRQRQRRKCDSRPRTSHDAHFGNLERPLSLDAGCAGPQPRLLATQASLGCRATRGRSRQVFNTTP